jgi:hypothetical protein
LALKKILYIDLYLVYVSLSQTSDNVSRYLLFQTSGAKHIFEIMNTGTHYHWFERAKDIFEIMNIGTHYRWSAIMCPGIYYFKPAIMCPGIDYFKICLALSNQ